MRRRPVHGWLDLLLRSLAAVGAFASALNIGTAWGIAWIAFAFGLLAASKVERLQARVALLESRERTDP